MNFTKDILPFIQIGTIVKGKAKKLKLLEVKFD